MSTEQEWGDGLTGEEMRALKGIVPDDTPVKLYATIRLFDTWTFDVLAPEYHLPSNSPVYAVRDWNAKHPDERPFVPHCGDTCPVDGDVLVEVLLRDGKLGAGFRWTDASDSSDIIGYRLAEPATESEEGVGELAGTVTLPRMTEAEGWDESLRGPRMSEATGKVIFKYQMPVLESFTMKLPAGAQIIRTEDQGGMFWLWAVVDTDAPMEERSFMAFKTGASIPRDVNLSYVGFCAVFVQMELGLYIFEVLP